jgi:hypothetical protein
MANTNAPFGLRYIGMAGGASANSANKTLKNGILSTNTTAIFTGDLLTMQDTGYLRQWLPATSIGSDLWGVFAGCKYASASLSEKRFRKLWPGSDAIAGTIDADFIPADPMSEFVIQTDATGITLAAIGEVADIAVGSGNTTLGFSGAYLDTTKINTTAANASLRIVDLWANRAAAGSPGTEAGAYNWAVVRLNVMTNAQGA